MGCDADDIGRLSKPPQVRAKDPLFDHPEPAQAFLWLNEHQTLLALEGPEAVQKALNTLRRRALAAHKPAASRIAAGVAPALLQAYEAPLGAPERRLYGADAPARVAAAIAQGRPVDQGDLQLASAVQLTLMELVGVERRKPTDHNPQLDRLRTAMRALLLLIRLGPDPAGALSSVVASEAQDPTGTQSWTAWLHHRMVEELRRAGKAAREGGR